MPLNIVDELRSAVYRNMYRNKSALYYARRAYVSDSLSHDNPSHLLRMTVSMAELFSLLSDIRKACAMPFRGWSWRVNLKIYSPNVGYCFVWERTKEGFLSKKRGLMID